MKLLAQEQRLLDFAREQFDQHLSQFLLAGLGKKKVGQRGRFEIIYASGTSTLKRHVKVITYEPTDGSSYLPRDRNPLVLIALLYLLINDNQRSLNTLRYKHTEVLSLLGWKDIQKARREIDEAVDRYFKLTYQWKLTRSELASTKSRLLIANESMLTEYKSIITEGRKSARVVFNEHFIEQLLGRSLFGIDWNNVQAVSLEFPSG